MKYVFADINNVFDTEISFVNTLVIENREMFYGIVSDLFAVQNGEEGKSIVSQDGKVLSSSKNIEMISQFIPFDINQKSLVNKMISAMAEISIENKFSESMELLSQIERFLTDSASSLVGDIIFSKIDITSLIRSMGAQFSNDYTSLAEKLIDYIELVEEYDRKKLFFFINLRSYISDKEAFEFFDTIIRHQYNVIMIDSSESRLLPNEKRYIVDKDLCEIS